MTDPLTKDQIVHFAPTAKRLQQRNPMCGYFAQGDGISTDLTECTCEGCADWLEPVEPEDDTDPYTAIGESPFGLPGGGGL